MVKLDILTWWPLNFVHSVINLCQQYQEPPHRMRHNWSFIKESHIKLSGDSAKTVQARKSDTMVFICWPVDLFSINLPVQWGTVARTRTRLVSASFDKAKVRQRLCIAALLSSYTTLAMSRRQRQTLPKAQRTQGIAYFDSVNTITLKQKLQKASWSTLRLVLHGKGQKI